MAIDMAALLREQTDARIEHDNAYIHRGKYAATRTPVIIILDKSDSMSQNDKIGQLNRNLRRMLDRLHKDRRANNSCDLAVVTVDSSVQTLLPYTPLPECPELPELKAGGVTLLLTAVQQALEMIRTQQKFYRDTGTPCHCPMLWILTDGRSVGEDDALVQQVVEQTASMVQAGTLKVFAVAIGADADCGMLRALANGAAPLQVGDDELLQALRAVSDSVISVSRDADYLLQDAARMDRF